MKSYSIEELIEIFSRHAIEVEERQKEMKASFEINNPGEELPEFIKDDFNISKAFLCMCREILELKNNQ